MCVRRKKKKCLTKTEVANLQGDLRADVKIEAAFTSVEIAGWQVDGISLNVYFSKWYFSYMLNKYRAHIRVLDL